MADIIVAGNTSGAITISAPLVAGSGVLTLPTGTDTLVGKATTDTLTNKSIAATQLTGTIAASVLPAGSVLQVVQGTLGTQQSTTSASFADTGLTVTITPRSTSSTVLILVNGSGFSATVASTYVQLNLLRGASTIINFNQIGGYSSTVNSSYSANAAYLDSPSSVSATTYKVQWARSSGTGTMYLNNGTSVCTIIAMEIQG